MKVKELKEIVNAICESEDDLEVWLVADHGQTPEPVNGVDNAWLFDEEEIHIDDLEDYPDAKPIKIVW